MSDGLPYADIVILALIAGFVLLRLRSVLGQKIGQDPRPDARPDARQFSDFRAQDDSPIVQLAEKTAKIQQQEKDKESQLVDAISDAQTKATITAITAADRDFRLSGFLDGARAAFEMVHDGFNKDDRETLKMLLSTRLFDMFCRELDVRKTQERKSETTLLSILSLEVLNAKLEKSMAQIVLRFVTEQVTVVRDSQGKIVEGDPGLATHVEDHWTFERDINSRNPNWKIMDT